LKGNKKMKKNLIYVETIDGKLEIICKYNIDENGNGNFFDIRNGFEKEIELYKKYGMKTREGKINPIQEPEKFYSEMPRLFSGSYAFWAYEK
jgi:hypothetical protein